MFKIGDKIRALEDIRYIMGQDENDKIEEGEICTVDDIPGHSIQHLPFGYIGVKEHADRYGPWPEDSFELVPEVLQCQNRFCREEGPGKFEVVTELIEHVDESGRTASGQTYASTETDDLNTYYRCARCGEPAEFVEANK